MNFPIISIAISVVSLVLSATTLWLTILRRGRLAMTTPSIVFFGYDEIPKSTTKVFLRTLLYSTATQGQVVEGMHVILRYPRGGDRVYGFWGYDEGSKLVPGSGLYVGRTGVAANHHFVQSVHEMQFTFDPGDYVIEVYARLVGKRRAQRLATVKIDLSAANAHALKRKSGVLFERLPDSTCYAGHISADRSLPKPVPHG